MTGVRIIRELPLSKTGAQQVLVRQGSDYYVVSSMVMPITGAETLVFRSNSGGKITEWNEVAGGRGMSREEAIADLADRPENEA